MILIPRDKKWSQKNSGEVFGMLYTTKNINFDKEGYAQLAKRPIAAVLGVSNLLTPVSIDYMKGSAGSAFAYYVMTEDRPFSITLDGVAPVSQYNATGRLGSIQFDGLVWYNRWYISQGTSFSNYDGNAWVTGQGTLSSPATNGAGHPMCVFESQNYLAIGDHNTVLLYSSASSSSHTLVQTLTLPSNFEVRWIRYNNQKLYIGTKNIAGGDAMLFVWSDTTVSSAQQAWPVPANWMFSGVIYKSSVVTVTSRGQLLRFNGGGWDELANFPVYYSNYSWYQGNGYVNGKVEQRGMATDGNLIYININGDVGDSNVYLGNQPSGLWVFDPAVGLYHKAGISNDKYQHITVASVDTGTDVITSSASFTALTGTKLFYHSTSGVMTGLKNNKYYYMIQTANTTFKLATSYANAIAGTAINITGAGSGTETFGCSDEFDAGLSLDTSINPGAIAMVSELDSNPVTYGYMSGSQVLFGAGAVSKSDASGSNYSIQSLAPSYNVGYLITQKIFANDILENFYRLVTKCNRLFQTSDKVILKYRTADKTYYPFFQPNGATDRASWTSGTVFTTTADLSNVTDGEEVEFTGGRAAGRTAHIVSHTLNAGTYTVTIDETMPGVVSADKSGFAIQNWTKLGNVTSTTPETLLDISRQMTGKRWIQLKIEIRGHSEPIVEEQQLITKPHTPSS